MSAPTSPASNNTNEALFLAPETLKRAGGEGEFLSILQEALTQPGIVNAAYRAFHNYSIGNQILAAMQLTAKGLPLSPIASFNTWKDKGRFVKKGQQAISLFMPVSVKRKERASGPEAEPGEESPGAFNLFMLRANWFSLDQTEGEEYAAEVVLFRRGMRRPRWRRWASPRRHSRVCSATCSATPSEGRLQWAR